MAWWPHREQASRWPPRAAVRQFWMARNAFNFSGTRSWIDTCLENGCPVRGGYRPPPRQAASFLLSAILAVRLFDTGDLQLGQRISDSMQMLLGQMQILGRGLQISMS